MKNTSIITTEASKYLGERMAKQLNVPVIKVEKQSFSNGEIYYRIDVPERTSLMGQNIIYIGSTHSDEDFLELIRVGGALAEYGVQRKIFVIPFLGYSTMERVVIAGEIATAKESIRMLSAIPSYGLGNTFLMLDLHAPGSIYYFEGNDLRFELHSERILTEAIRQLKLTNFMFASADLGRPRWIESFSQTFGTDIALISKTRFFEKTKVRAVIGDVTGKNVIIYDDMIRSGGSLIKAAEAYLDEGATSIYVVVSHLALNSPEIIDQLEASPIKKIVATNSHPMSQHERVKQSAKFTILDISPLFSEAITQIL